MQLQAPNKEICFGAALLSGKSRSCGCISHRLESLAAKREHSEKARVCADGRWWCVPRIAMKSLDVWWTTLNKWAPHVLGCRTIEEWKRARCRARYGRRITYYAEDDLQIAQQVKAESQLIPQFANLVYLKDALRVLGWSRQTLGRRMAATDTKFMERYGAAWMTGEFYAGMSRFGSCKNTNPITFRHRHQSQNPPRNLRS